jgi:PH (Pleckstrin Homology) domain-containing protein/putative oligomerization/nucleic acid binding protein
MGYAERLMSTGERIVHREKQHWFVFIWGARYTILAIIIAGLGAVIQTNVSSPWREILGWAAAILFIGGLLLLGWTILRYVNQEYVLTNRRVIEVEGVLNKRVTDSSLEKVNDIVLTQSIFGRMFGFGDLEILTASETGISRFRMLIQPVRFKREMLDAKHEYERDIAGSGYVTSPPLRAEFSGGGPPTDDTVSTPLPPAPAPAQPLSRDEVTQTLNSLADLRDRGAISSEEFERKKADLLARL